MKKTIRYFDELTDFIRQKNCIEKVETAMSRLENLYEIDRERIVVYQSYLFDNGPDMVPQLIDLNRIRLFPLLVRHRVIRKSNIAGFIDYARDKKKTDILFYLMEVSNSLRNNPASLNIMKKFTPGKSKLPLRERNYDFSRVTAGDILWLGKEPTPWLVLENKNRRLLIISWFVLDCKPYTNFYSGFTTWSRCSCRLKLHTEYMDNLFTEEEKSMLVPVYIDDADDSLSFEPTPSRQQEDKMFFLSVSEVEKYFREKNQRRALFTKYSTRTPMWTIFDKYAYWWLRSPGNHTMEKMHVRENGDITSANSIVNGDDCFDYFGVRPAVYMKY
ncbi:MAG: hypothetical protein IKU54_07330 [Oscillospiraceae bacterium]|nr:hypothetical protein [Oscillospiraceae bacterium]